MKLENLSRTPERKATKRVGRGAGSGMGKTSTRGENGQKSRSGASIKVGSKVDKAHYIEEYQKEDLIMLDLELNLLQLI